MREREGGRVSVLHCLRECVGDCERKRERGRRERERGGREGDKKERERD